MTDAELTTLVDALNRAANNVERTRMTAIAENLYGGEHLDIRAAVQAITELRAQRDEAVTALRDVRSDLLMRAEKDDDGTPVVAVGCGVWLKLNATLAKIGGAS